MTYSEVARATKKIVEHKNYNFEQNAKLHGAEVNYNSGYSEEELPMTDDKQSVFDKDRENFFGGN